jgi:hypothetical protein
MPVTGADLMKMSQAQLDDLYKGLIAGPIPDGDSRGTALFFPGTFLCKALAWTVRSLNWKGKVFNAAAGTLVNKVSAFGFKAIKANVYFDASWLDGNECIVLDYSRTSLVARKVRDEIRMVAPGLYLGKVFLGKKRFIDFVIEFVTQPAPVESEAPAH